MWSIIKVKNISKKVVNDLFDGVESDLDKKVQLNNKKDFVDLFLQSCWTVGLMMAKILKVKNDESLMKELP